MSWLIWILTALVLGYVALAWLIGDPVPTG